MVNTRSVVPPVNAELVSIEIYGEIGEDEYGTPEIGWEEIWSGSAPAFVTTTAAFRYGSENLEQSIVSVSFPSNLAAVTPRWRLRYVRGGSEHMIEVDQVEDRSDAGFLRAIAKTTEGTEG
jgi:hypothetical protein